MITAGVALLSIIPTWLFFKVPEKETGDGAQRNMAPNGAVGLPAEAILD